MSEARLIVGLGNTGRGYEFTRHNLGFLVLRHLAEQWKWEFQPSSLTKGYIATGQWEDRDVQLLIPTTNMNRSGQAIKPVVDEQSLNLEQMLVVCDDFNLDFGQLRIRPKGSNGGHNGLGNIIERLNTEDFPRLRMGVGKPKQGKEVVDYVLEEFSRQEKKHLEDFIREAAECCQLWIKSGIAQAMDQYNQRKE